MDQNYRYMEWTDDRVKKFWDYESQFPENYFTYQVGQAIAHSLSKYVHESKTVLDYGCGSGFLIKHLLAKNIRAAAMDFSPKSIELVSRTYTGHHLFQGGYHFEEIMDIGRKFDLISVVEVIEHLNDSYLGSTITNVKQLLADDGLAFFTTPNEEDLSKSLVYCPASDSLFHRWQHIRSWSAHSLQTYLEHNGFVVIDIFTTDFTTTERELNSKVFKLRSRLKALIRKRGKLPHLVAVAKLKKS